MIEEKKRFLLFLKQQKGTVIAVTIFSLLAYGFKVFFYSNQFDTVQMSVKYQNILEWWISIGRYALVITKRILENGFFNIYFSNFLTLVLIIICPILWSYILYKYTEKATGHSYWVFGILFVTTPIMAEQLSFSLQNWEVMLAYVLTALAVDLFFKGFFVQKKYFYVLSAVLMGLIMGVYQNFIAVFALGFLAVMLLQLENFEDNKKIFKQILIFGLVCLGGLIIYEAGNKITQGITGIEASGYLGTNIKWFSQPVKESVYAIYMYIRELIFSNDSPYSSVIYGILFILFILEAFWNRSKFVIWSILFRIGIVSAPFYFAFLFGNSVGLRVQTILPVTVALTGWYLIEKVERKKEILAVICMAFIGIFSLRNAQIMCQAFYSDYCSYNNDVRLADEIRLSAGEAFPENSLENLVFLNVCTPKETIPDNIFLENIGTSIFGITWLSDYDRQSRVTDFFNYLGYATKYWSWEEFSTFQTVDYNNCDKKEYGEYILYSWNNATIVQFK